MPYVRKGSTIYKKTGKKLKKKGKSKSAAAAKKYIRTLQAVEHGWEAPKRRKTKRKKK